MSNRYWILATETATQGIFPSVMDYDSDYPMLFDTLEQAEQKAWELLEQHNQYLQDDRYYSLAQIAPDVIGAERIAAIREIIDDYQYQDEPFDFPLEVEVHDDGSMTFEFLNWELSRQAGQEMYDTYRFDVEILSRFPN
jgi:hypothetical protein